MADKRTSKDRFTGIHIPGLPSVAEIEKELRSLEAVPETTGAVMQQVEAVMTRQKAEAHVDWLLRVVRPLMIEQFIHGFKHGLETRCDVCHAPEASER